VARRGSERASFNSGDAGKLRQRAAEKDDGGNATGVLDANLCEEGKSAGRARETPPITPSAKC
jgi:hypothetical protein